LMHRDQPLIVKLERQAGQKEARYAHLLCGEVTVSSQPGTMPGAVSMSRQAGSERIAELEKELEALRSEFNDFRQTFEVFRKQFE
jgi:uncharacterized protein YceH (UPF0502 family)